jgi:hypothetical protein
MDLPSWPFFPLTLSLEQIVSSGARKLPFSFFSAEPLLPAGMWANGALALTLKCTAPVPALVVGTPPTDCSSALRILGGRGLSCSVSWLRAA